MTDCETFEVELEMHAHGALDASRVGPLQDHLAQCESCRRYQALLRRTESTMSTQALEVNGMESRIQALHAYRRNRSWLALAVPAGLGTAVGVLSGHLALVLAIIAPCALVTFGALRLRLLLEARETAALSRDRSEYLSHYRRVLARRIRRIQVMSAVVPLFAALTLAEATLWDRWPASMNRASVFMVIGAVQLVAIALVWSLRLRQVPALRKELRDLDAA